MLQCPSSIPVEELVPHNNLCHQQARNTLIAENTPIDYLDFASPAAGPGSKMGIDATHKWPGETSRSWSRPITMDAEVKRRVDSMSKDLGL